MHENREENCLFSLMDIVDNRRLNFCCPSNSLNKVFFCGRGGGLAHEERWVLITIANAVIKSAYEPSGSSGRSLSRFQ